MYLLIKVGGYLGAATTIGLVMLTAVIGVWLLKRQGLATLTRGLSRAEGGSLPAQEIAEGLLLAVAGALLLTPGFVTDGIGFALLTPVCRQAIAKRLLSRVQVMGVTTGSARPGSARPGSARPGSARPGSAPPGARPPGTGPDVIEGEFERRH